MARQMAWSQSSQNATRRDRPAVGVDSPFAELKGDAGDSACAREWAKWSLLGEGDGRPSPAEGGGPAWRDGGMYVAGSR
jgi:hypothetical protein